MSFLELRGEKIFCKKCGACITIEYEGGPQWTQIGDMGVWEQVELNQRMLPGYNPEKNGYYYIRLGAVCENCKDSNIKVFDENYILARYLNKYCELEDLDNFLMRRIENEMRHDLTEELLQEMAPEAFEKYWSQNHFGIKKEKMT